MLREEREESERNHTMATVQNGEVVSLRLCIGHREPMRQVETATLTAGFGIEGDRHATRDVARAGRQVLLMDEETLEALSLERGDVRENISVSGMDLAVMASGHRLMLGNDVVLRVSEHCAPCARMDELRPGLRAELEGRRGVLASVEQGGTIKPGDPITVQEPGAAS
jgi:MOSC domain-containing protein YiiM